MPHFSLHTTPIPTSLPSPLQCSVSCGRGIKHREIACVYQNQTKIEEEHCSHLPRPRTQKACRARGCPGWKANRWREVGFALLAIASGSQNSVESVGNNTNSKCCEKLRHKHKHFPKAANVRHVHTEHLSNHRSVYSCPRVMCHFLMCELNTAGCFCRAVYVVHLTFRCQL